MSGNRSSRVRRHSRRDNEISDSTTTNKEEDSENSSKKEASSGQLESPTISSKKERTTSSSSVKSSRRQSLNPKISDDSENVQEKNSTYSKYESSSNSQKRIEIIDSVRKVENFLQSATLMKDNRESETPEYNESSKRDKRRKSRKKRREKNRVNVDSNRTEDDDAYDEEVRSSERERTRSRTKKSQPNIRRKSRRKSRCSRGDSPVKKENDDDEELPITEILRKAQENPKPRYEEPLPLTELTTDRIYVEGRHGFSAVKISNDRRNGIFRRSLSKERSPPMFPIRIAILAQKIWNCTGLVHQGLLAGMALMHLILVETFFRQSAEFLEDYSVVSEYYTNIFSYFVTMCVISAFDRFDLAQLDIDHYREIYVEHSRSFLAVPLYIATFCLHQTSLFVDNNISLIGYPRNKTENASNSSDIVLEQDLSTWQKVTIAKDSLAVLAWLFVVLGPREDMLLAHLKSMEKYTDISENSA